MIDSNDKTNSGFGSSSSAAKVGSSGTSAIIGSKIRFKGELVGEEDLIIQGSVDGTIDLKGNNLTVGQDGQLRANVAAKTVIVEGSVEGDIFGQEKIIIRESSNVKGNLSAARVSLEEGAKFKGSIDMDVSEGSPKLAMPKLSDADSVTSIQSNSVKKSSALVEKSNEKTKEKAIA